MDRKKLILIIAGAALFVALVIVLLTSGGGNDVDNPQPHVCYFSEWRTVTEPTCDSEGLKVRECTCGEKIEEEIDALGHSFSYADGVFITDISSPIYKYPCTRQGCSKTESLETNYSVSVTDPTCTEDGVRKETYYVFCGGEYYETVMESVIPSVGHSFSLSSGVWTWNGYGAASYKVSCEHDRAHTEVYTAIMSKTTEPATCTANGRIIHTATVQIDGESFSDSKNEILYKTDHSYDYSSGVWEWNGYESAIYKVHCANDPTHVYEKSATSTVKRTPGDCDTGDTLTYSVSVRIDGVTYTDTETVTEGAKGHDPDFDSISWRWSDDGQSAELIVGCKNNPSHTVMYEATVEYNVTVEPSCLVSGVAHAVATVTVGSVEYTDELTLDLGMLDHTLDHESAQLVWNGNESATFYVTCLNGGTHLIEETALADKWVQNPTCTEDGFESYTVTFWISGIEVVDTKEIPIPAHGHSYEKSAEEWIGEDGNYWVKIEVMCTHDYRHTASDIVRPEITVTEQPTCTKDGKQTYNASIEIGSQIFTVTKDGIAPKTGHHFGAEKCYNCGTPIYTEGLDYELLDDGSGYTLIGMGEYSGAVISIPNEYNGLPVLDISDNAFNGNTAITELYLAETITRIGKYAFNECTSLNKIVFSDAKTTIEYSAFSNCSSITELEIPASVSRIKEYAFSNCSSIVKLKVSAPVIYNSAFSALHSLRELDLEGVKEMGDAFSSDYAPLFSVTLPSTLTSIGANPFDCLRLVEVKNLSSLDIVLNPGSSNTFYRNTKNVYTDTEGESMLYTDPSGLVFFDNGTLNLLMGSEKDGGNVSLPDLHNGKSYFIYNYAFKDYVFTDGILYLPFGVSQINNNAFYGNKTIRIIYGAEGVTGIGSYAFYNCSELLSFTLGAQLRTIGTDAFRGCKRLVDLINHSAIAVELGKPSGQLVAPNAIEITTDKSITEPGIIFDGEFAFYYRGTDAYLVRYYGDGDDTMPSQVSMPESFMGKKYAVYKNVIDNIEGVYKVRLSSGVSAVYGDAFNSGISEIVIFEGLERLEENAFANTEIESIYLPSTLVYIGKNALPTTLTSAEFGNVNNWYGDTGLVGYNSVDPNKLVDPEAAAEYLLNHSNNTFIIKE